MLHTFLRIIGALASGRIAWDLMGTVIFAPRRICAGLFESLFPLKDFVIRCDNFAKRQVGRATAVRI